MITDEFGAFRTDAEGIGSKSDLKVKDLAKFQLSLKFWNFGREAFWEPRPEDLEWSKI